MLGFVVLRHVGWRKAMGWGIWIYRGPSKPCGFEATETKRNCKKEVEVERQDRQRLGGADRQTNKHRFVLAGFLWKAVEDRLGWAWIWGGGWLADQPEGRGVL